MFNSFLKKISPELLKMVSLSSVENKTHNCIIYGDDFIKLKNNVLDFSKSIYEYPFINAIGTSLSYEQILSLAKTSCITYITKQAKVTTQIYVAKKIIETEVFYKNNHLGNNITIAVIDTGIKPHLDFLIPNNRIIKFIDLINNKEIPYDDNGHGTFVSSIACGSGLLSNKKYSGIAPKSNIISIKALEENGETGAFKILEAMQWVYDNHKKYSIKVVCMSFGSAPIDKIDPLVAGAEALWDEGVVVVAAAGNSGPEQSTIKSPGISSKIITVGGLDDKRDEFENFKQENFEVASFSSRGPVNNNYFKPDIIAPAVNIIGVDAKKGDYTKMSGTSVATPMVAGVCALILSKNQNLSPNKLKNKLIKACKKISLNYNDDGFGLIKLSKFIY